MAIKKENNKKKEEGEVTTNIITEAQKMGDPFNTDFWKKSKLSFSGLFK